MIEQTVVSEQPILPSPTMSAEPLEPRNNSLEARVARLEDVVASLQDTHHLEERVTERLSAQLASSRRNGGSSPSIILEAGRQLLPAALQTVRQQTNEAEAAARPGVQHHPWLLFDAIAEARAIFRMYFDSSYRVSRIARVTPVVGGIMLMLSWIVFNNIPLISSLPLIGHILEITFDLALAFVAYKVLHREVQSYRFAIADLSAMTAYRTVSSAPSRSRS
jgi:hypothetical protein